jgi:hypothetical protein
MRVCSSIGDDFITTCEANFPGSLSPGSQKAGQKDIDFQMNNAYTGLIVPITSIACSKEKKDEQKTDGQSG